MPEPTSVNIQIRRWAVTPSVNQIGKGMKNGIVKKIVTNKGYGFIVPEGEDQDLFFHRNSLVDITLGELREGDKINFEADDPPKESTAINVGRDWVPDPKEELPSDEESPEEEIIAVALFDDKMRVVSLLPDGSYRFLDEVQNLHNILYVTSSETMALQIAVEELEYLVNNPNSKEKDLQDFFDRHRNFILNDEYKDAHPHMDVTFLVMASQKLKITQLQSGGEPKAVFEAYLGPDPYEMLFLAPKGAKDLVLYDDFKDILTDPSIKQLDFAKLRNSGKWVNGGYAVYTGSQDAGTRAKWEERLQVKQLAWWPEKLKFWNIRAPEEMVLAEDARIYLGSEVLFRGPTKTLLASGHPHIRLPMVDGSKGFAKRGLYLYGFLNTEKSVQHGDYLGYHLPKSITLLLKYVYKSNLYLFNKNEEKDKQCLQRQIDYFHLESEQESEAGWVDIYTGKDGIFGAKPCDAQLEE